MCELGDGAALGSVGDGAALGSAGDSVHFYVVHGFATALPPFVNSARWGVQAAPSTVILSLWPTR